MTALQIFLREGFLDDTVEIRVDGRNVYRKDGVTTRLQISRADTFETTIEGDSASVDVRVPSKNVETSIRVPATTSTVYLGLSVEGNAVTHRIQAEPFRDL